MLADTYGRRVSVITGFFLIGAGFVLEGWVPVFGAVLVAQVIWGAGYTFISGALQARIEDEDEVGGRDLGRVYLRGEQGDYLGSLVGVLASALLASALLATVALRAPLLLGGTLLKKFL